MNLHKTGLKALALSLAAVFTIGSASLTAASAAERSGKEQDITAYLFDMDDKTTIKCMIYDDMPSVPYINVMDYLGKLYDDNEFTVADNGNGVYTVTGSTEKAMVIDTEKDTVHFDEYENFLPIQTTDADNDGPEAPYVKNHAEIVEGTVNSLDLDYGKYQIDITSANGSAYFPLTTIADLFPQTYLSAIYLDNTIYFMQSMGAAYFNTASVFNSTLRSKDLIDYTYRELCFVIDKLYGRPPKSKLTKELENAGFDEVMSKPENSSIKELLLSDSLTDFYTGLVLLDSMLDDGGHTGFSSEFTKSLLDEKNVTKFSTAINQMLDDKSSPNALAIATNLQLLEEKEKTSEVLAALRKDAYSKYETVKTWEADDSEQIIAQLVMNKDTAVFVFDEFTDAVVAPFKWSLDYAKEKGAKNFLIDLSQNGGGSNAVVMYMMSIMTGKSDLYSKNMLTGNKVRKTGNIDRNLDNVIDEKDAELNYDFHFALLTTQQSFSCGNYLPCLAQEQEIPVIGETSGGGTCYLSEHLFPCSVNYPLSGFRVMLKENGENVDAGAAVNYETVTTDAEGNKDYSKLYDIDTVAANLDDYYSKHTPTKAAVKTPSSEKAGNSAVMIILVIACVVILFAVVIIVIKKRGKKESA